MSKNQIIECQPDFELVIADDGTLETWRNGRRYSMSERQEFYRCRLAAADNTKNLSASQMTILAGTQKKQTINEPTLF